MKELSEDEAELVVKALLQYDAYLLAAQRQDGRYKELAERLERKGPKREESNNRPTKQKKA
jgi:hypothetical protein